MCFSTAAREGAFQKASRKVSLFLRSRITASVLVKMKYQLATDMTRSTTRIARPMVSVCVRKLAKPTAWVDSMESALQFERDRDQHPGRNGLVAAFGGDEFPAPHCFLRRFVEPRHSARRADLNVAGCAVGVDKHTQHDAALLAHPA